MQGKPGTPIEVLNELAENPRFKVLRMLCAYPHVPSEVLDKVGNNLPCKEVDTKYHLEISDYLAYHPNSSSDLLRKIVDELEQVNSSLLNENYTFYSGTKSDRKFIQKINNLIEQINKRLKGEHLAQTDKFYAHWTTVVESQTTEDRYSWENLYESDPKDRK